MFLLLSVELLRKILKHFIAGKGFKLYIRIPTPYAYHNKRYSTV